MLDDKDFKVVIGFYAAVILAVLGFWGFVLWLAYRVVMWLTAG